MRCEARREGTIHAAHAPSGFRDLQSRHAEWQRLGEPVDLLGPAEVAAMTGSPAFHGGLWDHRAGTISPMGYVRGLARAALAAGAKISTGVRATKIARDGDHWRVDTDRGAITARNVVLGTNAYTDRLWPGLTGDTRGSGISSWPPNRWARRLTPSCRAGRGCGTRAPSCGRCARMRAGGWSSGRWGA